MLSLKPQIQQQTPTRYRRYQTTADATLKTGKLQLFTTSNHPEAVGRGPHGVAGRAVIGTGRRPFACFGVAPQRVRGLASAAAAAGSARPRLSLIHI